MDIDRILPVITGKPVTEQKRHFNSAPLLWFSEPLLPTGIGQIKGEWMTHTCLVAPALRPMQLSMQDWWMVANVSSTVGIYLD